MTAPQDPGLAARSSGVALPTRRAGLYGRFSSDGQNPRSADDQLTELRALAARLGATVAAEFKDEALSAMSDNRPGFQALMAAARRGEVDLVLAESMNRLSRTGGGTFDAYDDLKALGVGIHTLEQGALTLTLTAVEALKTALGMEELGAKVRRGLRAVTRDGRHNAAPPYGYLRPRRYDARGEPVRGLLAIDEAQAAMVRRIGREFLGGSSGYQIASRLNGEGVPGPGGRPWANAFVLGRASYLDGILRNPIYAGEIVWGRTRQVRDRRTGARKTLPNPGAELVRHAAPELAIFDPPTWAAIQQRLAERAHLAARFGNAAGANAPRRLLSGLVRCGVCGGGMHASGSGFRYRCLARAARGVTGCSNARTAPAAEVEAQVMAELQRDLLHPEVVEAYVREVHAAQRKRDKGGHDDRAAIEKRLADARRQAQRLVDQVAEGHLQGATVTRKLAELEDHAAQAEAALARHAARAEVVTLHPHAAARYRQLVEQLQAALAAARDGSAELDAARAALRQVIHAVRIYPLPERGRWTARVEGDLTTLLGLAKATPARARKA